MTKNYGFLHNWKPNILNKHSMGYHGIGIFAQHELYPNHNFNTRYRVPIYHKVKMIEAFNVVIWVVTIIRRSKTDQRTSELANSSGSTFSSTSCDSICGAQEGGLLVVLISMEFSKLSDKHYLQYCLRLFMVNSDDLNKLRRLLPGFSWLSLLIGWLIWWNSLSDQPLFHRCTQVSLLKQRYLR